MERSVKARVDVEQLGEGWRGKKAPLGLAAIEEESGEE